MERTHAGRLDPDHQDPLTLPERVSLAVIDVSFISLTRILRGVQAQLTADGEIVALVKPQFEAGRDNVGRGGVVRDPAVHRQVLLGVWDWAVAHDLTPRGLVPSPIRGPAGNVEMLLWLLNRPAGADAIPDAEAQVAAALAQAPAR